MSNDIWKMISFWLRILPLSLTVSFPTRSSSSCQWRLPAESTVAAALLATLKAHRRKAHTSFAVRPDGDRYLHSPVVVFRFQPVAFAFAPTRPAGDDLGRSRLTRERSGVPAQYRRPHVVP